MPYSKLMATAASTPGFPTFPSNDGEAESRFNRWRTVDPFPDVPPALLNSADLLDYIATAGILHPFAGTVDTRDDWVKPASCAVGCTGDFLRFELDAKKLELKDTPIQGTLQPSGRLWLPANTITFLQLGTVFRVPTYMAARFNLAIREIHRGILVGTGPLVDPGFAGRLLIPLHNLTSSEYSIEYGEPLIWVEFTKLSPSSAWGASQQPHVATPVEFPERKVNRKTTKAYLDHANAGKPIASSIPQEVARAKTVANKAMRQVKTLRRAGAVGVVLGVIAVALAGIWPVVTLISDTNSRLDRATGKSGQLAEELKTLRELVISQGQIIVRLQRH
jgi:deoxycytidine triphosphate deaminase